MAYLKSEITYKLNTGSSYAVLTIDAATGAFVLTPTDASYNPINLSAIDDSYTKLYLEALRVVAIEIGQSDGTTEQEIENRAEWVRTATQIDIIHPGGTYSVSELADPDVFNAAKANIGDYLNEKLNIKY